MTDQKSCLLLIDDDEDILMVLADYLSDSFSNIAKATSGKSGLELIQKEKFDLVVLDLVMPDIGGVQVLQEIKKAGLDIPVIMLSGHFDSRVLTQCERLGAYKCLSKPPESSRFVEICKGAIYSS